MMTVYLFAFNSPGSPTGDGYSGDVTPGWNGEFIHSVPTTASFPRSAS